MHISNRIILLSLALFLTASTVHSADKFSPYVDSEGNISFPDGFRQTMVHLGSWFVPEGGASGFHDVYTEAASLSHYQETGAFPDGATVVKELRASVAGDYSTGKGVHRSTDGLKQWFVMIKDADARFPDNPLWGDGWGWALFKPDNTAVNAASAYKTDCLGCHVPAKETDWIYTEAYPILAQ